MSLTLEQQIAGIRAALAQGRSIGVPAIGHSMWPLLRPGDTVILSPAPGTPSIGAIVLVRLGDRLIAHRVVERRRDGNIVTQGDLVATADPPVAAADVIAYVAAVERVGRGRIELSQGLGAVLATGLPRLRRLFGDRLNAAPRLVRRGLTAADDAWTSPAARRLRRRFATPPDVRPAAAGDATALDAHYLRTGRRRLPGPDDGPTHVPTGLATTFVARNATGTVVGSTHLVGRHFSGDADSLWIHDTYVERRHRGLGLGKRLTEAALAEVAARRPGATVRVVVDARNRRSSRMHEGLGFVRTAEGSNPRGVVLALAAARRPG